MLIGGAKSLVSERQRERRCLASRNKRQAGSAGDFRSTSDERLEHLAVIGASGFLGSCRDAQAKIMATVDVLTSETPLSFPALPRRPSTNILQGSGANVEPIRLNTRRYRALPFRSPDGARQMSIACVLNPPPLFELLLRWNISSMARPHHDSAGGRAGRACVGTGLAPFFVTR